MDRPIRSCRLPKLPPPPEEASPPAKCARVEETEAESEASDDKTDYLSSLNDDCTLAIFSYLNRYRLDIVKKASAKMNRLATDRSLDKIKRHNAVLYIGRDETRFVFSVWFWAKWPDGQRVEYSIEEGAAKGEMVMVPRRRFDTPATAWKPPPASANESDRVVPDDFYEQLKKGLRRWSIDKLRVDVALLDERLATVLLGDGYSLPGSELRLQYYKGVPARLTPEQITRFVLESRARSLTMSCPPEHEPLLDESFLVDFSASAARRPGCHEKMRNGCFTMAYLDYSCPIVGTPLRVTPSFAQTLRRYEHLHLYRLEIEPEVLIRAALRALAGVDLSCKNEMRWRLTLVSPITDALLKSVVKRGYRIGTADKFAPCDESTTGYRTISRNYRKAYSIQGNVRALFSNSVGRSRRCTVIIQY